MREDRRGDRAELGAEGGVRRLDRCRRPRPCRATAPSSSIADVDGTRDHQRERRRPAAGSAAGWPIGAGRARRRAGAGRSPAPSAGRWRAASRSRRAWRRSAARPRVGGTEGTSPARVAPQSGGRPRTAPPRKPSGDRASRTRRRRPRRRVRCAARSDPAAARSRRPPTMMPPSHSGRPNSRYRPSAPPTTSARSVAMRDHERLQRRSRSVSAVRVAAAGEPVGHGLRQRPAGDQPELGRLVLDDHRHQATPRQHPDQRVAVAWLRRSGWRRRCRGRRRRRWPRRRVRAWPSCRPVTARVAAGSCAACVR